MKPVSFFRHVHDALSPFRWVVSIVVSLLVAGGFAAQSVAMRAKSDQQLLVGISPYLATLVESQDRPEILRVLQSISESRSSGAVLVQEGVVLASTRSIGEMDQPFREPRTDYSVWGLHFAEGHLQTSEGVSRQGGPELNAKVMLLTPLRPVLLGAVGISLAALLLSLSIAFLSGYKMRKAIRKALLPVEQLQREIAALSGGHIGTTDPIQVRELEAIRKAIHSAKAELENTKERLAEERAKKLSAASYKRLIHDLHNPVVALRQWVTVLLDSANDEDVYREAAERLPKVAEQILNQVSAAKKNLDSEPAALREGDLRSCLETSARIAQESHFAANGKRVDVALPDAPVVVPHDPVLLQRAIVNLLENGLEACTNQVKLSVDQREGFTSVAVSDDGHGMEETYLSRCLQGQGESSKGGRQALGLSSAHHIVRSHGGRIVYRTSAMGGAEFEIRLGAL